MSDVTEMNIHRICDRNLDQSCSDFLRHLTGILISSVCCTKARHCHSNDILLISSKHVKCACRYKQCKCRIQTSGNADNSSSCIRMSQTFLQSHCLDRQDLLTALCAGLFIRRNERLLRKCSCQKCLCLFHGKWNTYQSLFIQWLECRILSSLTCNSLKIDL